MKKVLLIIGLALLLTSCYKNIEPITNTKEVTTIHLQELKKADVKMSIEGEHCYIFNEKNEVLFEFQTPRDSAIVASAWYVFPVTILMIIFFILLIEKFVD